MTDTTYDTDDPYGLGYEQGLEGEVQVMDCLTTTRRYGHLLPAAHHGQQPTVEPSSFVSLL